jgi:hypothetical protein
MTNPTPRTADPRLMDVALTARRMVEDGHPSDRQWFDIMSRSLHEVVDLTDAAIMGEWAGAASPDAGLRAALMRVEGCRAASEAARRAWYGESKPDLGRALADLFYWLDEEDATILASTPSPAALDVERLTAALRAARPDVTPGVMLAADALAAQWARDVHAIADALAADNPRFDRDRFMVADLARFASEQETNRE